MHILLPLGLDLKYTCVLAKLTTSKSGKESFKVLLCEKKVDETQNLTYNERMMPKVVEPRIK